jgi:hypothetical protein
MHLNPFLLLRGPLTGTLSNFDLSASGILEANAFRGPPSYKASYMISVEQQLLGLTGNVIKTDRVKQSIEDLDDSITNMDNSGHNVWNAGAPYWSNSSNTVSIIVAGSGYIDGRFVTWTAPQSVVIPANTAQLIYVDVNGTVQITAVSGTPTALLYNNKIPLITALWDGTNLIVTREDHDYDVGTQFTGYVHSNIGTIVQGSGGNITQITTGTGGVATDREVMLVGDADIVDAEIVTTLTDSGGAALTINWYYTNATGKWVRYAQQQEAPIVYNNAGTITALTSTRRGVATLYAAKNNSNTSTPIYIAVIDVNYYNTAAQARNAISAGTVAQATNELQALQLARLAAIIYTNAGSTYIDEVDIQKSSLGVPGVGGGASGSAALTTLVATGYANFLSTSDTNVQAALNDINANVTGTGNLVLASWIPNLQAYAAAHG